MIKRNSKTFSTAKWRKWKKSNNNNSLLLFCLILFTSGSNLFAQKLLKARDIKGVAYVSGDVSPNQARLNAINEAKINALKDAGIGEHINSYQLLFTSQNKNDYSQFFSSDIQSEIEGAVESYEIKSERIYCKSETEIVYEVIINAEVIKYDSKPDIGFDANVEGIKGAYNNDDKLTFGVKTSQKSYLTIFNITDKEASVLYPNAYEKQVPLSASILYDFPTAKIDYTLHTDIKPQETNRLIFVFTKTPIPFVKIDKDQLTTNENIFSWIYSIMPDQRKVEYMTLTIQN